MKWILTEYGLLDKENLIETSKFELGCLWCPSFVINIIRFRYIAAVEKISNLHYY